MLSRIAGPYSIGWTHVKLARITRDEAKRDDLVRWLDETGGRED